MVRVAEMGPETPPKRPETPQTPKLQRDFRVFGQHIAFFGILTGLLAPRVAVDSTTYHQNDVPDLLKPMATPQREFS